MKKISTLVLLVTLSLTLLMAGCSKADNSANTPSSNNSTNQTSNSNNTDTGSTNTSTNAPSTEPENTPSQQPSNNGGSTSENPTPISTNEKTVQIGNVTALRLADSKAGWVAGNGQIARTDDGGAHWRLQYSGSKPINQIFALSSNKVWATIGDSNAKSLILIQSTNGGKSWTKAGTVPNHGFLHFTNDKTAFSGNAMTKDGGKTWTELQTPGKEIGEVYFHDVNNGWAVQVVNGRLLFMHTGNGGKTWNTVMTRKTEDAPNNVIIRSTAANDAWIELIGGSGMSQTSYSLFHTANGGKTWLPAIVRNGAGSGPAPGFTMDDASVPKGMTSSAPGTLYVVNPQTAIMGGQCSACDKPNTIMKTTDGGKHWTISKSEFTGYGTQFIGASDASHIWFITTDASNAAVLNTSSDGGKTWHKAFTFKKPQVQK
ncbi:WD40/YVTN/BNR-like repeat-containing protein [Paenibacillus glycanilyticus]|uniref:WD40/YVTN/BNR-like repeat-containing protein n=1 Tax=Paenibacillus glycanilyticus TaxID=126569 RepID=UPI000FDC4DE1|nr:YCF48-related protein [Paenibacillus glycanilyticus]